MSFYVSLILSKSAQMEKAKRVWRCYLGLRSRQTREV